MSDTNINQAKTASERLSLDRAAQELADDLELAAWNYKETLRLERLAGIEEGFRLGMGMVILGLCKTLDVEVTPERLAQLRDPSTNLRNMLDEIAQNRRWPDPR